MGYRKRVDANQRAIVQALRACGWYVHDTSRLGGGYPDVTAARAGHLLLIEIKDGTKPISAQVLTLMEAKVHRAFAASGCPVRLIRSIEEALTL